MNVRQVAVAVASALGQTVNQWWMTYASRQGLLLTALPLTVETIDAVPEAVRDQYVEKDGKFQLQVDGIEDTSGLKSALEKERRAAREASSKLKEYEKKYEGVDVEQVRAILNRFANDEEAQLIKEGKIDEVITRRTEKMRTEAQRQVEDALGKVKTVEQRVQTYQQRVLENEIRAAAIKAGVRPHAVDDALFRGRALFQLDEEGRAVQLGKDGHPILGKDGKTPFTPMEWIEGMKEAAPHWFPAPSSGSGARGDGGGGGDKTIKRSDFDKLDPQSRSGKLKDGYKIVD